MARMLLLLLTLSAFISTDVFAQGAPVLDRRPEIVAIDENGVDLRGGTMGDFSFSVSLGAVEEPAIDVVFQRRAGSGARVGTPFVGKVSGVHCYEYFVASWCNRYRKVEFGGYLEWFVSPDGSYPFKNRYGETYTFVGGFHVVTLRDGTRLRFDPSKVPPQAETDDLILGTEYDIGMLLDTTRPSGEVISSSGWSYDVWSSVRGVNSAVPSFGKSNAGYAVKFGVSASSSTQFFNLGETYCSQAGVCGSAGLGLPSVSGSYSGLSDPLGGIATRNCVVVSGSDLTCSALDRSGRSYQWTERRYDHYIYPDAVQSYTAVSSVNKSGLVTNYSYVFEWHNNYGGRIVSATATHPNGETRTVRSPTAGGGGLRSRWKRT